MHNGGFVNQVFCDMVNWQWYHDMSVYCLFMHLLCIVNKSDKMELGISVKSGSVLISYSALASFFKLTKKQIIYALEKLESSHDISITNMHRQGAIITITEWNKYNGFNAISENANNAQNRDNGENLSQNCHNQEPVNNEVTTLDKNNLSQNCHVNGTKQAESDDIVTKLSQNCHNQTIDVEQDTKINEKYLSQECHINNSIQSPKESEKEDIPPIPPIEVKDQETYIKEENIKEESSSKMFSNQASPQQMIMPGFNDFSMKPPRERIAVKNKKLVGIIDDDKKKWKHDFPYLDIDALLEDAEIYLGKHPKKYTDVFGFLNNMFKRQPYPFPNTADDVLQMANERKLTLAKEAAEYFFNKYQAIGWMDKGKPIHDWRCLLDNFAKNPWANRNNTLGGNNNGNTGEQPERLSNGEWNNKYVSKFGDANWADQQNEGKW